LILLPQTYGPFFNARTRALASRIVQGASMAWARDAESYANLKSLLGDRFDPQRHRQGVDVAFGLAPEPPSDEQREPLAHWLDTTVPVIGINVSGLLFNQKQRAVRAYGLAADYPAAMRDLIETLLRDTEARLVLVPHVNAPLDHPNSDSAACHTVRATFRPSDQQRILVAPEFRSPAQAKWLIGQCDWFCGTRMHSCIAAMAAGVPTAAVAYSDKTRGVFATCGLQDHVADPRTASTETIVHQLLASWQQRGQARATLAQHLPTVRAQVERQMDQICQAPHPTRADVAALPKS
jgi:polysaccharide pyruvyl transferase WcaK-like protein